MRGNGTEDGGWGVRKGMGAIFYREEGGKLARMIGIHYAE